MNKRVAMCAFCIIILCGVHPKSQAQVASTRLDIQSLMTAAEFKKAGLDKLSDAELTALSDWVGRFASKLLEVKSNSVPAKTPDVIESQIDGDFEGWEGETIFKLTNGQIWQQSSYAYTYHYSYMPDVMIYKTTGGYKMKVEDVDDTIIVKRLK